MSEFIKGVTQVRVTEGEDKGKVGTVYNFYTTEGVTTVAIKFGSNEYGQYKLWHVEEV